MSKHTRNGYVFETEVAEGLEVAGVPFFKIPDSKAVGRVIPIKVPADFIYSFKGQIFTLEAKQTRLHRIPWTNFKEHQLEWVLDNPHSAAFVVNFNNRLFGKDKINRTFLVTAKDILRFKSEYTSSIPIAEFYKCRELERKTKSQHPENKGAFIEYRHEKW